MENNQDLGKGPEYKRFALKRMIVAILVIIVFIWALSAGVRYFGGTGPADLSRPATQAAEPLLPHAVGPQALTAEEHAPTQAPHLPEQAATGHADPSSLMQTPSRPTTLDQAMSKPDEPEHDSPQPTHPAAPPAEEHAGAEKPETPTEPTHATPTAVVPTEPKPVGVTFVEAVIQPMEYELNDRFWGWRSTDVIKFTDNINYFQLGVLEVTRRAVVQLAERISRTGSTDAFNRNLENAMNGLMINADRYWFPSPESKYQESLEDLETYRKQLLAGKASFYTRTDNLIPLLAAFEGTLYPVTFLATTIILDAPQNIPDENWPRRLSRLWQKHAVHLVDGRGC